MGQIRCLNFVYLDKSLTYYYYFFILISDKYLTFFFLFYSRNDSRIYLYRITLYNGEEERGVFF